MAEGLILSVGGTLEPLVRSLCEHRPKAVCFLTSQESIELVPEVKKRVSDLEFRDYKVIIEDVNDTTHCYEKALVCCDFLQGEGIPPENTVVDFTGGTKVMSAALALLAVSRGCRLSYVGGSERNKEGVGTVITGAEQVFTHANPWDLLAVYDRRRAAVMFNRFQFEAAIDAFDAAASKTQRSGLRRYSEILRDLTKAYRAWDMFRHQEASPLLGRSYASLQNYATISNDAEAHSLADLVHNNLAFLEDFRRESGNFREPCRCHMLDLLANAKRREAEGKYDDGVARLYRGFELLAQLRLRSAYKIEAGEVGLDSVPPVIREEFQRNYLDPSLGTLRLPSHACYRLLQELGDDLGKRYLEQKTRLQALLSARNTSILAHGFSPVKQEAFSRLWQMLLEFGDADEAELPVFPQVAVLGV